MNKEAFKYVIELILKNWRIEVWKILGVSTLFGISSAVTTFFISAIFGLLGTQAPFYLGIISGITIYLGYTHPRIRDTTKVHDELLRMAVAEYKKGQYDENQED